MKTKVVSFLLAACLLALVAWLVYQNNTSDVNSQNALAPFAQGGERKPDQANAVPEKYRDTVHKGLEYLAKNQCKDGHWEGDDGRHPVAMTGLVGLALLMERNVQSERQLGIVRKAKYSANICKAVDWLTDRSQAGRHGLIFSEHASETARYMQGHGLTALFLAGARESEHDDVPRKKLTDIVTRAVKYIVNARSTQGGWYHTSKVEGHDFDTISATVIQIQALQAAENADIPIPSEVIRDAQEYLKMALGKYERAKREQNRSRPPDTAAALLCCFRRSFTLTSYEEFPTGEMKDELGKKWLKYCQTEISMGREIKFGRDELTHYYYAQAVFNLGGDAWNDYRTATFDHLQSSQNKDGSWPAGDGLSVGPVYATALWCTILQLDRRSHPSMERVEMVIK